MDKEELDRIYAAAVDEAALFDTLAALRKRLRCRAAGLFRAVDGHLVWERSSGMPDGFMEAFARDHAPVDPRVTYMLDFPAGQVLCDAQPEIRRLMDRTPLLDFAERNDLHYTAGSHLIREGSDWTTFYVSTSEEEGPPDRTAQAQIEARIPHLARSMQIRRMHQCLSRLAEAQDRAGRITGQLFVDLTGRVRWLDAGAERILEHTAVARICAGGIRWSSSSAGQWFESSLALARDRNRPDWPPQAFQCRPGRARGRLILRVLPGAADASIPAPVAGCVRHWLRMGLEWHRPTTARGVSLTSRQCEVLDLLDRGLTTAQAAHRLGCAHATVRNHAQALLQKFNAHSRVQMLRRARELDLVKS